MEEKLGWLWPNSESDPKLSRKLDAARDAHRRRLGLDPIRRGGNAPGSLMDILESAVIPAAEKWTEETIKTVLPVPIRKCMQGEELNSDYILSIKGQITQWHDSRFDIAEAVGRKFGVEGAGLLNALLAPLQSQVDDAIEKLWEDLIEAEESHNQSERQRQDEIEQLQHRRDVAKLQQETSRLTPAPQKESPQQKPANENPMEVLMRREEMMKEFRRQTPPGEDLSVCDTYSAWLKAWKDEHGEAAHLEMMEKHQEFELVVEEYLKRNRDTR